MDVSIWEVYRKEKEVSRSPVGVPEDFFWGFLFRSPFENFLGTVC